MKGLKEKGESPILINTKRKREFLKKRNYLTGTHKEHLKARRHG